MSTLRLVCRYERGRMVRWAWRKPSLLREQSINCVLWCKLLLSGSSRNAEGMCTYLLNSDSAWRTIKAYVSPESLKPKVPLLRKAATVVGMIVFIQWCNNRLKLYYNNNDQCLTTPPPKSFLIALWKWRVGLSSKTLSEWKFDVILVITLFVMQIVSVTKML